MKIPFNKLYLAGREISYMKDALARGAISGDGYYTEKVQEFLEKTFQIKKVLLTTSGSSALEMAVLLLDLGPGDEVIMPSFTFVSTANAVILRGARPVFAEVEEETLNLDPDDFARKLTKRTRAVIPVHYAGVSCAMEEIKAIAKANKLFIIEDAAHAINALYRGAYLGSLGDLGCYSFHATKNCVCGEGGALLINTEDPDLLERARIIRDKGTNRSRFLRGEVDKYTWIDLGSSFLPADLLAAFLYSQLQEVVEITAKREALYRFFYGELLAYQERGILRLPVIPDYAQANYHIFFLIFPSGQKRDKVMKQLRERGVEATFHYIPLHSSPMGKKLGYRPQDLPLTERISSCLLRIPLYTGMKEEERDYVIQNLKEVLDRL